MHLKWRTQKQSKSIIANIIQKIFHIVNVLTFSFKCCTTCWGVPRKIRWKLSICIIGELPFGNNEGVMYTFICQPDWDTECLNIYSNIILAKRVRMVLDEVKISIVRLSKIYFLA